MSTTSVRILAVTLFALALMLWRIHVLTRRRSLARDASTLFLAHQWVAVRDLRRALNEVGFAMSYGGIYVRVRRLCEAGFLESRDETDDYGPVRFVRVTAAGREWAQRFMETHADER